MMPGNAASLQPMRATSPWTTTSRPPWLLEMTNFVPNHDEDVKVSGTVQTQKKSHRYMSFENSRQLSGWTTSPL
jgi:hypothetical protein